MHNSSQYSVSTRNEVMYYNTIRLLFRRVTWGCEAVSPHCPLSIKWYSPMDQDACTGTASRVIREPEDIAARYVCLSPANDTDPLKASRIAEPVRVTFVAVVITMSHTAK